jgi:hypothetical protein
MHGSHDRIIRFLFKMKEISRIEETVDAENRLRSDAEKPFIPAGWRYHGKYFL